MRVYLSLSEMVVDMHERGYTDDFELNGDDIYWVQKKLVLNSDEFLIIECHSFLGKRGDGLIIFGIVSPRFLVKGLMLNHYNTPLVECPLIILKKVEELVSLTEIGGVGLSECWSDS